ncbi:signal peptide peptidase SppA [Sporosarcina sp. G11-34]|uniref:signal peptide peptidase SppA n=1 Tax=Sporosarcina sp. G11-34 TaxID=2849605 RepID=UPI0022A99A15|nr:signal peptide peptidase SppA [Sporosarcina sp. G11-34]MCZ2259732.1 signal peptide peptidase SppA [Sporosarcina sp. G11-34]
MTTKRWVAILVASVLLALSLGINTLSYVFSQDFSSIFDDLTDTSSSGYSEVVIEEGAGNEKIAVLSLDGVIQDLGGVSTFLADGYNHQFFMNQLAEIHEDSTVKGVVLRVNTPGGGVVESADIYDAIREIQTDREIPVYVSMGGMAASGGYYVAAPADKIFVNRETITGSIGVIMESVNYAKLAEKHGIEFNTIKTGPYKDIMSGSREMTDEERGMLEEMISDSYERFVEIIVDGRDMSEAEVKKVADGRILNGRQAIEAGLADDYGKAEDVILAMQSDFNLEDATVFEYSVDESLSSLLGLKAKSMFAGNMESEIIGKLLSDHSAPRMMYLYGEK